MGETPDVSPSIHFSLRPLRPRLRLWLPLRLWWARRLPPGYGAAAPYGYGAGYPYGPYGMTAEEIQKVREAEEKAFNDAEAKRKEFMEAEKKKYEEFVSA